MRGERFLKVAFLAPFKIKPKEYDSAGGYAKEYGNRAVGGTVGALGGGTAGALAGGALGGLLGLALKKRHVGDAVGAGALAGGALGSITGGITGDVKSLHKSERMAKRETTGLGGYLGRGLASSVAGGVIPIVGGPLGDYYASRKMIDPKKTK